jgi:hypothetical protein
MWECGNMGMWECGNVTVGCRATLERVARPARDRVSRHRTVVSGRATLRADKIVADLYKIGTIKTLYRPQISFHSQSVARSGSENARMCERVGV